MQATHIQLTLQDGRRLSVTDCGPQSGSPVIYLHGNPGSRTEVLSAEHLKAFHSANLRVIAIDRPGYGQSSPPVQTGHQWLHKDLAETLDHLGIASATVVGYSRGTLPALAAHVAMPDRIRAIGLFGATGMPDDPRLLSDLPRTARLVLQMVKHTPHIAKTIMRISHTLDRHFPASRAQRMKTGLPSRFDHERLRTSGTHITQSLHEGTQHDPAFIIEDWRSWLVHPLGFRPESVRCPVLVWSGQDDQTCPPSSAARLANRMPLGQFRTVDGYGHLHSPELLVDLMCAVNQQISETM